ncbi:MAG: DUF58 domain-containing protein, partial [Oscillospiraceae bacterium]|nr:DUF58 domain-containing protein [Oscillospiraceae bacterium]
MKRLKLCWYAVMAALFLTARLTGRRELFALLAMMAVVCVYALALNIWTIMSFSYVQELDDGAAVKGGETSLRVAIYNDKPYPFTLIRLKARTAALSKTAALGFSLMPRGNISFTVPLVCPYRGVFRVGMTELEVNDSFGLVKTVFRMDALPYYRRPELKVFPRLTELPVLPARRKDAKDWAGALGAESGESYSALRKYRPGDALKRVHRAASAKRRGIYVKTYDMPNEGSVLISIDTFLGGASGEDALYLADLACECAAAVAHYSLRAGNKILLHETSSHGLVFTSINDFARLQDRLAVMRFEGREDPAPYAETLLDISRRFPGPHSVY